MLEKESFVPFFELNSAMRDVPIATIVMGWGDPWTSHTCGIFKE
jgi:hypothetical protein